MKIFSKRQFLLYIFFLATIVVLVSPAQATLVRSMNIQEIVGDAQYIIKATVISRDTALDKEESGHIVTYYTVKVHEWLKGTPTDDNELVFKQIAQGQFTLNGEQIRQQLFFPEYEVGKTYVLFLPEAHARTGMLAPVGLQQGVFDVITENGHDVIPQLKSRAGLLKTRLSTSKNKFLLFHINTVQNDDSYENFKTIIEAAGSK